MSAVTLGQLLLDRFRGRTDVHAVGAGSGFEPCTGGLTATKLEKSHLAGERCLGFYLLTQDSTCVVCAVDFDNKPEKPDPEWRTKTERVYFLLSQLGLHPLVEVSQSGNAAHVWLFLTDPTAAWLPRAFWRAVLHRLEITSPAPEIYPRQDRHATAKAMGNLIRYPLWGMSSFVDVEDGADNWHPLDPIAALAEVRPVSPSDLSLIAFQSGMGELKPEQRPELATVITSGEGCTANITLRVHKLIQDGSSLVGKRWRMDSIGMGDPSRSAVAMSLCCELVRQYVPTPEIAAALRAWCEIHDYEEKGKRDDWINRTVAKAYDYVTEKRERKSTVATTFRDAAHSYIDLIEHNRRIYVPSGIKDLDASIDGVAPGEVCVIAARPSHGKTAVALQWLAAAAALGTPGLLISEEMGCVELGKRRLQSIASIPHEQWVAASAHTLRKDVDSYHKTKADVYIVESCSTVNRVEEVIDQFCQLYGVGLIAIDYLQLIGSRADNIREVVTECSRRVKQAAHRNDVPILLLSQLNRSVEGRDDHEPKLSDLRESGGIEQDADLVLFPQYPCRFNPNEPQDVYRIYVGKRRNGPIRQARIETKFDPHKQIVGFPQLPDALLDL